MMRFMLKSKVHHAMVTDANINYEGSITIDEAIMQKANLLEYEKVAIANMNNGQRFETYVIKGQFGSGQICLNGAASRLSVPGDIIHIFSYITCDEDEAHSHQPLIIHLDDKNAPIH